MRALDEFTSEFLDWTQPRWGGRYWELYHGDELLATLGFEKFYSSFAVLRTTDGTWTLQRKGIFNMDVLIHEASGSDQIGIYHPRWTGREGRLSLNQRRYDFTVTNFWSTRFELQDAGTGTTILSYRHGLASDHFWDGFKTQATMRVTSNILSGSDLALLSGFGMYSWILMREQAAAAASASTAASA